MPGSKPKARFIPSYPWQRIIRKAKVRRCGQAKQLAQGDTIAYIPAGVEGDPCGRVLEPEQLAGQTDQTGAAISRCRGTSGGRDTPENLSPFGFRRATPQFYRPPPPRVPRQTLPPSDPCPPPEP